MAQFFGSRSRFIIIMQRANYITVILMWVVLAYLVHRYMGQLFVYRSAPILSSVVLSVIYFPMAYWILREKKRYQKDGNNYKQGGKGEGAIYYELLKLPNNYLVFQDVKFPKKDFNIDFVVLGTTGIFAIEVKSHKGLIRFNGTELTKNGKVFAEGDPTGQAMQQALDLNSYITKQTGANYFVHPVVVFSNNKADVKFGFNPVKNTYVIKKGFLIEMVTGSKPRLSEDDKEKLKTELVKLVYPNRKQLNHGKL